MSNKKIHIAMSISLIVLFTTSLIAFILTCTINDTHNICGYVLSMSIPSFFICLVIYIAIIEYRNTIKFNTSEILHINKCVEEFLDNKPFCKICKNYAKNNDLPIMIMEYAFIPYSYVPATQNFKLKKYKIDDFNTNYLKQVRACQQEDLDQNSLAVKYAFEYSGKELDLKMNIKSFQSGCKFEVYASSDENRNQFSEMNKLYLSLINQKVINVPTDRNHYLAFLYLLYVYRKEHFFKEAKARVENLELSINEESNIIIEKLYDNDYQIGLIATTLYSLYSYENKYIDMSSFHYSRFEEITTRVINEIKEKRKI